MNTRGLAIAVMATFPASAANLDADAKLETGRVWSTERMINQAQAASFEWKADGTVCLRLGETSGECGDGGTWKMVDSRVCYALTGWLEAYDMTSECLGVMDLGKGAYKANLRSGSPVKKFTVLPWGHARHVRGHRPRRLRTLASRPRA